MPDPYFGGCPHDYYEVLEVGRDADYQAIRASYRKLALLRHPDKNGDSADATEQFKLLQNAYSTLADAKLRSLYDEQCPVASPKNQKVGGSGGEKQQSRPFWKREEEGIFRWEAHYSKPHGPQFPQSRGNPPAPGNPAADGDSGRGQYTDPVTFESLLRKLDAIYSRIDKLWDLIRDIMRDILWTDTLHPYLWSYPFHPMPSWSYPFHPMPSWSYPFHPMPSWSYPFHPMPPWSYPFHSIPPWFYGKYDAERVRLQDRLGKLMGEVEREEDMASALFAQINEVLAAEEQVMERDPI